MLSFTWYVSTAALKNKTILRKKVSKSYLFHTLLIGHINYLFDIGSNIIEKQKHSSQTKKKKGVI